MVSSQLEELRPCGRLETYSTARHHLGFYNNVGLTATYTTPKSNGSSLQDIVYAALHHVIAQHPILSAIPINENKSHPDVYFARLRSIDLRTCVECITRKTPVQQGDEADSELDSLLREQHARNFKGDVNSRPYWRLIVASSPQSPGAFTASWIFHHALSDGASSMLFHKSFLEGLNATTPQTDLSPFVETPSTPPSPPLEELNPMTISWPFFLHAIGSSVLPNYFAPRPQQLWTGEPILETAGASHNSTVIIPAEVTKAFARKCRDEKTSVTAALSTLLAAILSPNISLHNEIRINTPISLRPFLDIPADKMVNAITDHTSTFTSTTNNNDAEIQGFDWATARRIKHELVGQVEKEGRDNPVALLRYVSNMHEYFAEKVGKERESSAEVSNLGVWRPNQPDVKEGSEAKKGTEENAKWTLGRMTFSQSLNRTGAQISLSAVTGGDGCLVLSFNWPADAERDMHFLPQVPQQMKEGIAALSREEAQ